MLLLLLACTGDPAGLAEAPAVASRGAPAARPSRRRAGRTLAVDCQGGADYADILDALDDATSGDTISVAPCTYYGSIDFGGKSVTIQSTGGAEVTTILGTPGRPVVEAESGEARGTAIVGFTLSGGGGPEDAAIHNSLSTLTIRDSVVTGNAGTVTAYARGGHLLLERVVFEENTPSEGVVVEAKRGTAVLKDTTIRCGTATKGYYAAHGAAFVDGTTFDCPGAVAVEVFHAPGRVLRSVLDGLLYVENDDLGEVTTVEGTTLLSGATVYVSDMVVRNSVSTGPLTALYGTLVVEATVVTGATCGLASTGGAVSTRYDLFWGNGADACGLVSPVGADGTSFSADPLFVDAAGRDFHLAQGSPAIDAGPAEAGYADPDGSRNDLGAHGGPFSQSGGW